MKNPFKPGLDKIRNSNLAQKLHEPKTQRNWLAGFGQACLLATMGVIIVFASTTFTLPVIIAAGSIFTVGLASNIASGHIKVPEEGVAHAASTPETGKPSSLAAKAVKPDFVKAVMPAPAAPGLDAAPAPNPQAPKA